MPPWKQNRGKTDQSVDGLTHNSMGMAGWFCLGLAILDLLLHTPLFARLLGNEDSVSASDKRSQV